MKCVRDQGSAEKVLGIAPVHIVSGSHDVGCHSVACFNVSGKATESRGKRAYVKFISGVEMDKYRV